MAIRRLLLLISVASLMFPMAASAQDPSVEAFERSPLRGAVDPVLLPNGIDDTRLVTVMVELEGDPVAVVQAKARGRELSRAEKDAIKAELKARQDAIESDIAARGGRVLGQVAVRLQRHEGPDSPGGCRGARDAPERGGRARP